MAWFGSLAISRGVADYGRNNQIFDMFRCLAREFRAGAELASLEGYRELWDTASCFGGDVRGVQEQSLHCWMTKDEVREFESVRISRITAHAVRIELSLSSALTGANRFYDINPDHALHRDVDPGFPGEEIVRRYENYIDYYKEPLAWNLPDPIPNYVVDESTSCKTGDEVPWTGIWYPSTGLEDHSLTFAIKGLRMQPAYRVVKSREALLAEGMLIPVPKTVALATSWHPVIESPELAVFSDELWAKAGQQCPKEGIWQPTDPGATQRYYRFGETMLSLNSAYSYTVWRWIADR